MFQSSRVVPNLFFLYINIIYKKRHNKFKNDSNQVEWSFVYLKKTKRAKIKKKTKEDHLSRLGKKNYEKLGYKSGPESTSKSFWV